MAETSSPALAAQAGPAAPPLPGTGPLLGAQVRYQLLLLVRNPRALILSLVIPVLLLVLSSSRHANLTPRLEDALVAGLATFGLIVTAYISHAIGLVTSRQDGVLRRWRATPLPTWCFFSGKIAATSLMALASVAIAVAAGLSLYHVHLTAGAALSLLVIFALGALAWAALGTAVTPLVPTAQAAGPVLLLTYLPVILFSGGLGSLNSEPGWLATLARYLPRPADHRCGHPRAAAGRRRGVAGPRPRPRRPGRLGGRGRGRVGLLLPLGPGPPPARPPAVTAPGTARACIGCHAWQCRR